MFLGGSLVAVTTKSVGDVSQVLRFQNLGSTQLTNLLCGLANGQVARASLAMLDLACRCDSESLLG